MKGKVNIIALILVLDPQNFVLAAPFDSVHQEQVCYVKMLYARVNVTDISYLLKEELKLVSSDV
jgi:hypothetical protein